MIPAACALAALTGWIVVARVLYARWRPSSLPVACDNKDSSYHEHWGACYRRNETLMIDSHGEAVSFALLAGLLWPLLLPLLGLAWLVRFRQPVTREELAAKIVELEREAGIR